MQRKPRDKKRGMREARKRRAVRHIARSKLPRLTVFRSAKHMYAQLVDAESGRTIATASTRAKAVLEMAAPVAAADAAAENAAAENATAENAAAENAGAEKLSGKVGAAARVGFAIAGLAKRHSVSEVVFNRNGFLYHGRVRALAEAARAGGLKF